MKAGIIGATGYAGQQLAAILANHPNAEIDFLMSGSQAGVDYTDIYARFKQFIGDSPSRILIGPDDLMERAKSVDCIFLALPHGESAAYVKKFHENPELRDKVVIDLGSDFRYRNEELSPVYGLSEVNRDAIKKANIIANPGCYPTAAALAIIPLLQSPELFNEDVPVIIDAKSGISGAGRSLNAGSLFAEVFGNCYPYKITNHQHTGEIENSLSQFSCFDKANAVVQFTPNIIPVNRGIIENIYIKPKKLPSEEELLALYEDFYKDEYFVSVLRDSIPRIANVSNTNNCQITVKVDERTKMIVIVSTIDNLIKGAAGQAVQNMNIRFGFDEKAGLVASPAHL